MVEKDSKLDHSFLYNALRMFRVLQSFIYRTISASEALLDPS